MGVDGWEMDHPPSQLCHSIVDVRGGVGWGGVVEASYEEEKGDADDTAV